MLLAYKKELESRTANAQKEDDTGAAASVATAYLHQLTTATAANKDQEVDLRKQLNQSLKSKPAANKLRKVMEIRLAFERKQLAAGIKEKVLLFDAELKTLRHERNRIGVLMKNAHLRHVTVYEEFMLLRDFEKTENELETRLSVRKEEHTDFQAKLSEVQQRIEVKRKDVEKIDESLKHLLHSLTQLIHDETKYGEYLTKVYKKKIKRRKKVEGEEEEESEEESEEEDDEDDDLEDEDDDSEGEGKEQLDLDICPGGLRTELYDQVVALREKRLDLEEIQMEEKKILDQFKKDQDSMVKKGRIAENSLKQAQQELENFQKEKQKKINNLDVVVMLRLDQIQFLKNNYIPADLSEALAFDSSNLEKLENRIRELQVEKLNEKKQFK
jgi:hypothetical protein